MGVPSMPELLIILTIVVLLFGAKKIPDLAAGIGKGIKNFKKAVKEDNEKQDDSEEKIESAEVNNKASTTSQKEETKSETTTSETTTKS